jgi:hypothetical protein
VCVCVDVTATDAVDKRQDILLIPSYGGVISVIYIPAVFMSDLHSCYGKQRSVCIQPTKRLYFTWTELRLYMVYLQYKLQFMNAHVSPCYIHQPFKDES